MNTAFQKKSTQQGIPCKFNDSFVASCGPIYLMQFCFNLHRWVRYLGQFCCKYNNNRNAIKKNQPKTSTCTFFLAKVSRHREITYEASAILHVKPSQMKTRKMCSFHYCIWCTYRFFYVIGSCIFTYLTIVGQRTWCISQPYWHNFLILRPVGYAHSHCYGRL